MRLTPTHDDWQEGVPAKDIAKMQYALEGLGDDPFAVVAPVEPVMLEVGRSAS